MATQRSIVNDVIVNTDAYDVISDRKDLKIQKGSPNRQGYDSQMPNNSVGRPKSKNKKVIQRIQH